MKFSSELLAENLGSSPRLLRWTISWILADSKYPSRVLSLLWLWLDLRSIAQVEYLKSDLVPMFVNLAQDEQVSNVRHHPSLTLLATLPPLGDQ